MDVEPDTLPQAVRQRRAYLKLTQQQAADRAGIVRKTWREIESGQRPGTEATLAKMDAALEWEPGTLLGHRTELDDPNLERMRNEAIALLMEITERRELKQVLVEVARLRFEAAKTRLEKYEVDAAHEEPCEQPH